MSKLKHLNDLPANNASFMSFENIRWFNFIQSWEPNKEKPLVLLPCARANKTRTEQDPRKFISNSVSHQFLSAITRNSNFERVILSEPLTIIPYELEGHILRPDYNLPPDELSIQSEWIFMRQLALWLLRVKTVQPSRDYIYYVGAKHHYFILKYSNEIAGLPFKIIYKIPERGILGYSKAAKEFVFEINDLENYNILPKLSPVLLEDYLNSRGRYTNKKFWHYILLLQKDKRTKLEVCSESRFKRGFSELYLFRELSESLNPKNLDLFMEIKA